ncbi:MAG: ferric reductase-like transmembrane domain-containing protein [Actinomycetota bacterium]|nr:ferric reductase-like transmembrane domain-containing protein [Actinomycetota bacterium]
MAERHPAAVADRGLERALWVAIYAVLALAPIAFLAAAPPTEDSDDVIVPVAMGFVGITMLALQVVIASRAPSLTEPFGIDRLIRLHRAAGYLALGLVAGHVVSVIGAEDDRAGWLNPIDAPLAGKLGLGAIVLLALLLLTVVARRPLRLRYEVWRGLHIAFGLGAIAFAFGHVIEVSRFTGTGTIRWLTLGFVVLALLAAFYLRVLRQFMAARRPYRLARSGREPDGSITLELEAVGHPGASFMPGQFAWLKHAGAPYALTEHPFSYASSANHPARPSFTVKPVGDFTSKLDELAEGNALLIDGPHGSPALVDGRDCVLIAGGSGITPAMSVLRTAHEEDDPRRLKLLYFLRDAAEASFPAELANLARRAQVEVHIVPSRPAESWTGPSGRVSREVLDELLPSDRAHWSYFVCGSPGMADSAEVGLRVLGIPRGAVRVERFAFA